MRTLSKSKLLAYRQCPKRLWLEIHSPELRADSEATEASFKIGHQVGDIARLLYDPKGKGALVDPKVEGFETAFTRSLELLRSGQPIFEAGFRIEGALAFADVMLPPKKGSTKGWRMVEVKSSTSVKDYHRDDAAIQSYIALSAGVQLESIALAHIDNQWTYPGKRNYQGLLVEEDLTTDSFSRQKEVENWISEAQNIARKRKAPSICTGSHCSNPYECGFLSHCQSQEIQAEMPIRWLPGAFSIRLQSHIEANGFIELKDVPDDLLNARQKRVKDVTLSNKTHFDKVATVQSLTPHKLPAYFMDFETIQFAVPIWKGTRPYQQIPFQFSVHRLSRTGILTQEAFLDLSGKDPAMAFAKSLIVACGERGPIFVYNAGFERGRVSELAARFPPLAKQLKAINERVVDLLPIAREHYYHATQQGSWSIKKVLTAICPDLRYDELDGVQDGGMAMDAFLEAISQLTAANRKAEIEKQLLDYCALDTYAMVRMWSVFSGQTLGN